MRNFLQFCCEYRLLCWTNIKINKLFINIESFRTLLKLVRNSALKKTILLRMWKNLAFPCDRSTLFWLFLFLFISSSLECVFPLSTKWTFTSNVKALALSRMSVSLISSGAMIFASKSLINLSILSSLLLFSTFSNVNAQFYLLKIALFLVYVTE